MQSQRPCQLQLGPMRRCSAYTDRHAAHIPVHARSAGLQRPTEQQCRLPFAQGDTVIHAFAGQQQNLSAAQVGLLTLRRRQRCIGTTKRHTQAFPLGLIQPAIALQCAADLLIIAVPGLTQGACGHQLIYHVRAGMTRGQQQRGAPVLIGLPGAGIHARPTVHVGAAIEQQAHAVGLILFRRCHQRCPSPAIGLVHRHAGIQQLTKVVDTRDRGQGCRGIVRSPSPARPQRLLLIGDEVGHHMGRRVVEHHTVQGIEAAIALQVPGRRCQGIPGLPVGPGRQRHGHRFRRRLQCLDCPGQGLMQQQLRSRSGIRRIQSLTGVELLQFRQYGLHQRQQAAVDILVILMLLGPLEQLLQGRVMPLAQRAFPALALQGIHCQQGQIQQRPLGFLPAFEIVPPLVLGQRRMGSAGHFIQFFLQLRIQGQPGQGVGTRGRQIALVQAQRLQLSTLQRIEAGKGRFPPCSGRIVTPGFVDQHQVPSIPLEDINRRVVAGLGRCGVGTPAVIRLSCYPVRQGGIIQQRLPVDAETASAVLISGIDSGIVQFHPYPLAADLGAGLPGMSSGEHPHAVQSGRRRNSVAAHFLVQLLLQAAAGAVLIIHQPVFDITGPGIPSGPGRHPCRRPGVHLPAALAVETAEAGDGLLVRPPCIVDPALLAAAEQPLAVIGGQQHAPHRIQLLTQPVIVADQLPIQLRQGLVGADLSVHRGQRPTAIEAGKPRLRCRAQAGAGVHRRLGRNCLAGTADQQDTKRHGDTKRGFCRHASLPVRFS